MRPVIPVIKFTAPVLLAGFVLGTAAVAAEAQQASLAAPVFPAGSKYAYINLQRVAAESTVGQAANAKVEELTNQKLAEIEAKSKELQGTIDARNQQLQQTQVKLEQGRNVLSSEARLNLQREISRLQVDIERMNQDAQADMQRITQDADAEVQALRQELETGFQKQFVPAIEQLVAEKKLQFLFNVGDGGLVWADRSLDLTQDLIDAVNAAAAGTP